MIFLRGFVLCLSSAAGTAAVDYVADVKTLFVPLAAAALTGVGTLILMTRKEEA